MATIPKLAPRRDIRFRRLLSHGYFPSELPPPFTSEDFAKHADAFAAKWNLDNVMGKFWTSPEVYSIPRFEHARRRLSIVNPVNQLVVARLIAHNWKHVRDRLKRSKTTEFKPRLLLTGKSRAISAVDFDAVARRRAEILSRYGRYVKTDIAQFYPSIYTHSIAWAAIGKDKCKAQLKTVAFKNSFANQLDRAVGSGQNGQTSGLPIGPDTSRIISEMIITEVEETAKLQISDWTDRVVRYVDDMLIGISDTESPSDVLSGLSTALYEYELELNAAKTQTLGLGSIHKPEWSHYISTFVLSASERKQRGDLDSFFEQALFLQDENPRDSVMLFATKRAATFSVSDQNTAHLIRWMLYAARRSPNCLEFVAEHLAAASKNPGRPSAEIKQYILQQIPIKAVALHTDELAWLLFWAIEIGLSIPAGVLSKAVSLRSSVVALLTLDLLRRGQVQGNLDVSFWQSFCSVDGLESEMWLVSYEGTKKGWWPKKAKPGYISGHQYFGDLWKAGVEFYDVNRRAKTHTRFSFSLKSLLATIEAGGADYR